MTSIYATLTPEQKDEIRTIVVNSNEPQAHQNTTNGNPAGLQASSYPSPSSSSSSSSSYTSSSPSHPDEGWQPRWSTPVIEEEYNPLKDEAFKSCLEALEMKLRRLSKERTQAILSRDKLENEYIKKGQMPISLMLNKDLNAYSFPETRLAEQHSNSLKTLIKNYENGVLALLKESRDQNIIDMDAKIKAERTESVKNLISSFNEFLPTPMYQYVVQQIDDRLDNALGFSDQQLRVHNHLVQYNNNLKYILKEKTQQQIEARPTKEQFRDIINTAIEPLNAQILELKQKLKAYQTSKKPLVVKPDKPPQPHKRRASEPPEDTTATPIDTKSPPPAVKRPKPSSSPDSGLESRAKNSSGTRKPYPNTHRKPSSRN
jgi:hypothetical protein